MRTLNPNIYPHDGHWFKEVDGTRITGDSWGGVIVRLKKYRERAGRPPGNPTEDVVNQVCARNPGICLEESGAYHQELVKTNLKSRILQWLPGKVALAERNEIVFVNDDLRQARSDVCMRCPLHTHMPRTCGSCKQAVEELRKKIIGNRAVHPNLGECPVLGEHLPVSVWIEDQTVANPELTSECWRKRVP